MNSQMHHQHRHRGPNHDHQPQDSRVHRHWDKLELIRDSLRPFEQNGDQTEHSESPEHKSMVDNLVRVGYDEDAALFALKNTNFISVEAAKEYLMQLNNDHANRNIHMENRKIAGQTIPIVEGSGAHLMQSNGIVNGNLHPVYGNFLEESGSSRSTSPQQAHMTSAAFISPRPNRQLTPVEKDYYRTHVHVTRNPSMLPGPSRQQLPVDRNRHMVMVEKVDRHQQPAYTSNREYYKMPLESTTSAPAGTSQIMLGAPVNSMPYMPNPVIRTTFSQQPVNNTVNINVRPTSNGQDGSRMYRIDVAGKDGGISSVHGISGISTGVQNIMIDPEQTRAYVGYEDELRPSTSYEVPSLPARQAPAYHQQHQYHISRPMISPKQNAGPDQVVRSTSPLPDSVAKRLKENKYERFVKPCQSRMYCFFMEQHVERMVQQYRDRNKRTIQLRREMEAANLADNMRSNMLEFLQQKESKYMRLRRQKMDVTMFDVIKHIGVGAFGKVSLVKKKDTGQVYAMKSLLKKDVINKQQTAHVKAERDILAEADSRWIVKLFFSFQDDRCLYFVMEYVPGGDMMQLLINKGIFEEKLARFYIAELTCALEYVHSLGFIHRDIKPDNILIDQQGHVKLTDFGLCTGLRWTHDKRYYGPENDTTPGQSHQRVDSFSLPPDVAAAEASMKVLHVRQQHKRDLAHSVVGTGNYMAPEVLMRIGHTQLCDWWSVGVILYEMVFGRPPFMSMSDDPSETQQKIINWRHFLDVSPRAGGGHLSRECISIILGLCQDKETRLGSQGGAHQVMSHPWFRNIDFKNLRHTRAEYIPRVEHAEDTSNFDPIEINETAFETLGKRAPNNPAFYEFTFRHFFDMDGQGCPSLRPTQKRPPLTPLFESARHEPTSSTESIVI